MYNIPPGAGLIHRRKLWLLIYGIAGAVGGLCATLLAQPWALIAYVIASILLTLGMVRGIAARLSAASFSQLSWIAILVGCLILGIGMFQGAPMLGTSIGETIDAFQRAGVESVVVISILAVVLIVILLGLGGILAGLIVGICRNVASSETRRSEYGAWIVSTILWGGWLTTYLGRGLPIDPGQQVNLSLYMVLGAIHSMPMGLIVGWYSTNLNHHLGTTTKQTNTL